MQSRTFLRLYLLHAIPMLLALSLAVVIANQFQFQKALPVVVCGIVFGGLVSTVKHSYRAGYSDAREEKAREPKDAREPK